MATDSIQDLGRRSCSPPLLAGSRRGLLPCKMSGEQPWPPRKISMIAVITLVMFGRASADSDIGLAPGKAHEHTLVASQSQSYGLSLQAGDFVEISVKQNGGGLIAIAYGPSGKKIRGFRLNGDGEVHFIAETTGRYRLDVGPDEKTKEGTYSIEIRKIITLANRQGPPLEYESPTIKALRIAVENGRQERVMAFWEEMKKRGAPLVEPLKDGGKNMLVTFLWKGDGSIEMSSWSGRHSRTGRQETTSLFILLRQMSGTKRLPSTSARDSCTG